MSIADNLPELTARWSAIHDEGTPHLKVCGNLSEQAAELPAHIGYYSEVWKEIYNVKKRMQDEVKFKRGGLFRFYTEKYPKALSTRDIDQYINSDKEYAVLEAHLRDIEYWEGQFDSLVQGFSSKNWMVGHITKLNVAGLEDVEI